MPCNPQVVQNNKQHCTCHFCSLACVCTCVHAAVNKQGAHYHATHKWSIHMQHISGPLPGNTQDVHYHATVNKQGVHYHATPKWSITMQQSTSKVPTTMQHTMVVVICSTTMQQSTDKVPTTMQHTRGPLPGHTQGAQLSFRMCGMCMHACSIHLAYYKLRTTQWWCAPYAIVNMQDDHCHATPMLSTTKQQVRGPHIIECTLSGMCMYHAACKTSTTSKTQQW